MTEPTAQPWGQPPPAQPPARPRPKRRVFMWVILAVNAAFLVWLISLGGSAADQCAGLVGDELDACQTGSAIGTGLAGILVVFLWALVDVILGVIFLVTRRR